MKVFLAALILTLVPGVHTLEEAKAVAVKQHRAILLTFSGSDWCVPCIRMEKEVFQTTAFRQLADSSLVLLNADFPRTSQHKLPAAQQKINESLADQYNPSGKFPYTLLLDTAGLVIAAWEGYPADILNQLGTAVKNYSRPRD